MWLVHKIFHAMFDIKKGRLCWSIHVDNETDDKVLNIIWILKSDVHDATNPVIEGSPM